MIRGYYVGVEKGLSGAGRSRGKVVAYSLQEDIMEQERREGEITCVDDYNDSKPSCMYCSGPVEDEDDIVCDDCCSEYEDRTQGY